MRFFILFSFVAAILVVGASIPSRWEGERNISAYIPLRPLSIQEAAALMTKTKRSYEHHHCYHYGEIISLGKNKVVLGTFVYMVPADDNVSESLDIFSYKGVSYEIYSASWENYYTVHVLNRNEIEKELGRRLTDVDVDSECFDGNSISFSSNKVWLYALFEIVFIAFLLSLFFSIIKTTKSCWLIVPAISLMQTITLFFVPIYAPAFYDADWFYQRIFVEYLWLVSLRFLFSTFTISGFSLVAYIFTSTFKFLEKKGVVVKTKFRCVILSLPIIFFGFLIIYEYVDYRKEVDFSEKILDQLESELNYDKNEFIKDLANKRSTLDYMTHRDLNITDFDTDKLLVSDHVKKGHEVCIFIPYRSNHYIFLWNTPTHKYIDFRDATNTACFPTDPVMRLLENKNSYSSSFPMYFNKPFFSSRVLKDNSGKIYAIYSIRSEFGDKHKRRTPLRIITSLIFSPLEW